MWKRRPRSYPLLIVFKEKHGNRYFMANNEQQYLGAFCKMFLERYTAGWFSEDDLKEYEAELASFDNEVDRVHFFMQMRGDWEYEGYEEEYITTAEADEILAELGSPFREEEAAS